MLSAPESPMPSSQSGSMNVLIFFLVVNSLFCLNSLEVWCYRAFNKCNSSVCMQMISQI